MDKIILKCHWSPGDIVMLTAAVRDLHRNHPGKFQTDVRTLCPDLWLHNPHLAALDESDPEVRVIDCQYPLINQCDVVPVHCLAGFMDFLGKELGVRIHLTAYKGDIYLSAQEKAWFSQVHELTGEDTPFWLLTAGGKYDVTVKWWSAERYQRVVNHFRGKILFVQVGQRGHHHPRLKGVVDLRGCTSLRMLVRLVYHAQGVLCPVTALMHLAAAVETKKGQPRIRPCVVVAGGREPVQWELYPGHQFLHTIGALSCCARGGCWKDRTVPLGDGDPRDQPDRLCLDLANGLPHCMDLIRPEEVIACIERYYAGGVLSRLSISQWRAARRGIARTRRNRFEGLALTPANARLAWERFIREIPAYPGGFAGRGIVMCAGGSRLFTCAWVAIHILRQLGCRLPIEVWHLGPQELDGTMAGLLQPLGVTCVDASEVRRRMPCRRLGGWELKCYALLHTGFEEVLHLDADNVPVRNPEALFEAEPFRETGAVFWPDLGRLDKTQFVWDLLGLERPAHAEFESGQMLVKKERCWRALSLAMWLNENSDFFYHHLHGDKETFHLAFRRLGQPFAFIETPVRELPGTLCQHDFEGRRLFQHRNGDKWNLFVHNLKVADFWLDDDCRGYLRQLQKVWTGRPSGLKAPRIRGASRPVRKPPSVCAGMISGAGRQTVREDTLRRLAGTDWGETPLLELDDGVGADPRPRLTETARRLLSRFLEGGQAYLLLLEDDLDFNRHLRHNLDAWGPLRARVVTLASLHNPGVREESCDLDHQAYIVRPERVIGSQAFLLSRECVEHALTHWAEVEGMPDTKLSRLAGRLKRPLLYHCPSLTQHMGPQSAWGGHSYRAWDFDPEWKR